MLLHMMMDGVTATGGGGTNKGEIMQHCPVCFEVLEGDLRGCVTNNSICCPNRHNVCTTCLRKLLRANVEPCEETPTGFCYRCPICREESGMTILHLMVLVKESWKVAMQEFEDQDQVRRWLRAQQTFSPERAGVVEGRVGG